LPCTPCGTYAREGLFYLPYRKYEEFDPKHAVAGKRERGIAARQGQMVQNQKKNYRADIFCYVREHPIFWTAPTHILYGENDDLTSFETICEFANRAGATLTVMKNGKHRFSTAEQMRFPGEQIRRYSR